jgi:lactoylglutathione lyase
MKAIFRSAAPYADDAMNLPVQNVDTAIPYYEKVFEVDDVETAFAELKSNGLEKEEAGFRIDRHGDTSWKVFFVVAPDGLCYCLGERQS